MKGRRWVFESGVGRILGAHRLRRGRKRQAITMPAPKVPSSARKAQHRAAVTVAVLATSVDDRRLLCCRQVDGNVWRKRHWQWYSQKGSAVTQRPGELTTNGTHRVAVNAKFITVIQRTRCTTHAHAFCNLACRGVYWTVVGSWKRRSNREQVPY